MKIYCFAGPNGSGKSTIAETYLNLLDYLPFINADEIAAKLSKSITDEYSRNLAAAEKADQMRENLLKRKKDFVFETVLSDTTSEHNKLDFLKRAKKQGAEINVMYVLTRDKEINVSRVEQRISQGGHSVPEDKIRSRYDKCMRALPEVIDVSDNAIIYDNSTEFQTTVMLNKEKNEITIFSDNPKEDVFLQRVILNPLQKKTQYSFSFEKNLKVADIEYEL